LEKLQAARRKLLAAADAFAEQDWEKAPSPGGWSAAEVFAHLTQVETTITRGAASLLAGEPPPRRWLERLHLPAWFAAFRLMKVKSPLPLDPGLVGDKASSLAQLASSREALLKLVSAHAHRDLSRYWMRHPYFGGLNFYEWLGLVAYHERRHTAQLREIAAHLRQ
jgi:hypothetical protein